MPTPGAKTSTARCRSSRSPPARRPVGRTDAEDVRLGRSCRDTPASALSSFIAVVAGGDDEQRLGRVVDRVVRGLRRSVAAEEALTTRTPWSPAQSNASAMSESVRCRCRRARAAARGSSVGRDAGDARVVVEPRRSCPLTCVPCPLPSVAGRRRRRRSRSRRVDLAREVGVRAVDAGVDDRDGLAGAGAQRPRLGDVHVRVVAARTVRLEFCAGVREPPLLARASWSADAVPGASRARRRRRRGRR